MTTGTRAAPRAEIRSNPDADRTREWLKWIIEQARAAREKKATEAAA